MTNNKKLTKTEKLVGRIFMTFVFLLFLALGILAITTEYAPSSNKYGSNHGLHGSEAIKFGYFQIFFSFSFLCVWFNEKKYILTWLIVGLFSSIATLFININ